MAELQIQFDRNSSKDTSIMESMYVESVCKYVITLKFKRTVKSKKNLRIVLHTYTQNLARFNVQQVQARLYSTASLTTRMSCCDITNITVTQYG